MFGVVTRNDEELDWEEFERGFYEVKDVTGRHTDPVSNAVNMVSCFGDTATAETNPELVPIDDDGRPATRDREYFDWGYVCPSAETYRNGLQEVIETCVDVNDDVRLDDVGFPRNEYCHCDRCESSFAASEYEDWYTWRAAQITDFLKTVRGLVPGDLIVTIYPNPYPNHLYERTGVDVSNLAEIVDEFVVPLYDTTYGTTYWLEALAAGFNDLLETRFSIELYAVNVDIDNLVHAAEVAESYADSVLFGYEAGNARAVIRRMRADEHDGETYYPDDS